MSSNIISASKQHQNEQTPYQSEHKIRLVTAASLFDGHDASINIMRRILQSSGAEVVHLGHNRSAGEIVDCAIQEDVQGIAISSYQGGHVEYFKYMIDLLKEAKCDHIKVFGGGGGVIVESERKELHAYGVSHIFSVDDGRSMGLQGMINYILENCDFDTCAKGVPTLDEVKRRSPKHLARVISAIENHGETYFSYSEQALIESSSSQMIPLQNGKPIPLIGITGTGGAGKSTLTDELVRRMVTEMPELKVAILSVDPSKRRSGGALLGDRIRMNAIDNPHIFVRSLATRSENRATSDSLRGAIAVCRAARFDAIIVETSGIGQSDTEIFDLADLSIYVMTPDYGAATQLEKINMLDLADFVVLNKFEKQGAKDALRDIRKQIKRNLNLFHASDEEIAVYPTIASQFHDEGVNRLFAAIRDEINTRYELHWKKEMFTEGKPPSDLETTSPIPPRRVRYLSEISDAIRDYQLWIETESKKALRLYQLEGTLQEFRDDSEVESKLKARIEHCKKHLDGQVLEALENWPSIRESYAQDEMVVRIRDKEIRNQLYTTSLSGNKIRRVSLPSIESYGELVNFLFKENLPGFFPYTAGVFPFKRVNEDPTRMFAGEGTPERTNRRFHYVSQGMPAKRLSTAFDSVTLYGEDPSRRPDIYGKIGNSGVSICTVDDMKKLYSGFELTDPATSVSMTINGPAPMILAMFLNTAIDQEVERHLRQTGGIEKAQQKIKDAYTKLELEQASFVGTIPVNSDGFGLAGLGLSGDELVDAETYASIKKEALTVVRGTVQADILKEDQAQNTCIFSTEFALRMMGDMQIYFTQNNVRNYYSVSISGYHIAEAGANPITQAAFTLANGFTYLEYYLSRGLRVDEFAHNLSFFFSNGLDPEYAVIGRVARRIWAVALRNVYKANDRSQKLKYHIQTSGRSLHAQEIQFNDIRTSLQALLAVYDNCNSLHTNAFDEAITTPTEESVRRALAIQLIINREFGMAKNENPIQGSFIINELTDLVEEAILSEFDRLTERGGVLGAMESMYQRGKIQDESLYYESLKHNGELPIIGVNTFLKEKQEGAQVEQVDLIRSTTEEKDQQIQNLARFQQFHSEKCEAYLMQLQHKARRGENLFEELMETVKHCSLGQISGALYHVGGQYRRNM